MAGAYQLPCGRHRKVTIELCGAIMMKSVEIKASKSAQSYIMAGVAELRSLGPSVAGLTPVIGFPLSTWNTDTPTEVRTTSYADGPLVSLGIIEQSSLANAHYFAVGDIRVAVRLNPGQESVQLIHFDSDGEELSALIE